MAASFFRRGVPLNIVLIGDVTGAEGIDYLREVLPEVCREAPCDLVIANAENSGPGGRGINRALAEELYDAGVEILTLGNHAWDMREAAALADSDRRVVRPANFHPDVPGAGCRTVQVGGRKVAVVNLIGRTFMGQYDCPFRTADRLLDEVREQGVRHVVVDFHAEATSEKLAFAWHVAGRVSAVVGTHTHVQTADERVLPGGTAYITDVGMTGPRDGVLGVRRDLVIKRFLDQMPARFELAQGVRQFSAVRIELDDTGKALGISRIHREEGRGENGHA